MAEQTTQDPWTTKAFRWCFYGLFFLTPLIFYPSTYELFEFNKMVFVYFMTVVLSALFLLKVIHDRSITIRQSYFLLPLLVYVLVNILTTLTSFDLHMSIFGYYSRFNGGLLSTISYMILFLLFVGLSDKQMVRKSILALVASSAIVSTYAVLERLGIDKNYWVQDVQARVFSTLGQPNWLAAFLAMVMPIQIGFVMLAHDKRIKIVHLLLFFLNYLAFTFTYSRGGALGLYIGLLLFFGYLLYIRQLKSTFLLTFLIPFVLIFGLFGNALVRESQFNGLINKIAPPQTSQAQGSQLDQPGTESSQIRLIVWQGAWQIFLHHPIFGTGVETFADAYYQYRPQSHNQTSEWDFLYNKAHNEYLNELATKGVVGFISYTFLIGSYLFMTAKLLLKRPIAERLKTSQKKKTAAQSQPADQSSRVIAAALLSGYVSYLVQNIFGFSVVIIALLFFLFPALTIILVEQYREQTYKLRSFQQLIIRVTSFMILVIGSCFLVLSIFQYWLADVAYAKGYNAALTGYATTAYENIYQAYSLNTHEPLYQSQLGYVASQLVEPAIQDHDASLSAQLSNDAISFTSMAVKTSPHSIQYLRNAAKTYTELALLNQKYTLTALSFAQLAVNHSPTDPQDRLRLAQLLNVNGQNDQARAQFEKAITLKPDYRDARVAYAAFLAQRAGYSNTAQDMQMPAQDHPVDQILLHQAIDELQYSLTHIQNPDQMVSDKIASYAARLVKTP